MRRVFVGVIALAVLAVVAFGASRMAPAQPKVTEVLIGSVLPLTGNFASLGQQYLWASQTVEDIVNNDYDIQVPLGPGKGFPGSAARRSSSSCVTIRAAASRRAPSSSS